MGEGSILCPVTGNPMFVIITGGPVAGNPVRTIRVGHVAGTKTCGDYQRKNAQPDCAERILFCSVSFHDFKFTDWIVPDKRGLTGIHR
jgi:hypothetical protein